MFQVWGEKMSQAIIENMEKEKNAGNLELGRVGEKNEFELDLQTKKEMKIVNFEDRDKTNIEKRTDGYKENTNTIKNINELQEIKFNDIPQVIRESSAISDLGIDSINQ
jgi:hypothetical protein